MNIIELKHEDRWEEWKREVGSGDTVLGYWEWIEHQEEMEEDEVNYENR